MVWAMAPVGSAGFRSKEGGGEVGANLQRVGRGMVLQVSSYVIFSWVGGVSVAADSMPRQCRRGWGQSTRSSLGFCVIKCIAPYLSLRRSFWGKTQWQLADPTRWRGTEDWRCLRSLQGGIFWILPLQGIGGDGLCGGRSHRGGSSEGVPVLP